MKNIQFRYDINGLRAVAVLSVLFFHLASYSHNKLFEISNNYMGGGYLGVDIFFVISGFLMTMIIFNGFEKQNFTILGFWKRRAKRICPALLSLILFIFCLGYFVFPPLHFNEFVKEALKALEFRSNLAFAKAADSYFQTASITKTLLHTWSLCVEWQFYIIYPVILVILKRFISIKYIKLLIIAAFFASLATSFQLSLFNASYYLLPTRSWELLAGAIVYLYPLKLKSIKIRASLETAAVLALILSITLHPIGSQWAPSIALPTVIATMGCIWANSQVSIFKNVIVQYIGKISYSLYLIHWPVISFLFSFHFKIGLIFILMFILIYSVLSYHFLENSRNYGYKFLFIYLLIIANLMWIKKIEYFNFKENEYEPITNFYSIVNENENYEFRYDKRYKLIFMGDSHARHFLPILKQNHYTFINITSNSTTNYGLFLSADLNKVKLALNGDKDSINSLNTYNKLSEILEKRNFSSTVVFSQRYNMEIKLFDADKDNIIKRKSNDSKSNLLNDINKLVYKKSLLDVSEKDYYQLIEEGIFKLTDKYTHTNFFIIGDNYDCTFDGNYSMYNFRRLKSGYIANILKKYTEVPKIRFTNIEVANTVNIKLKQIASKRSNLFFIDPNIAFKKFINKGIAEDENGMPFYCDNNHYSDSGANIVMPYIMNEIKKITNNY